MQLTGSTSIFFYTYLKTFSIWSNPKEFYWIINGVNYRIVSPNVHNNFLNNPISNILLKQIFALESRPLEALVKPDFGLLIEHFLEVFEAFVDGLEESAGEEEL